MGLTNITAQISSNPATDFTGAAVQNAMLTGTIAIPSDWNVMHINSIWLISASIQSVQNLDWNLFLFSDANYNQPLSSGGDSFITFYSFAASAGKQIAGANSFYYPPPASYMEAPLWDKGDKGFIYIGLQNTNITAKLSGATGAVRINLGIVPVSEGV